MIVVMSDSTTKLFSSFLITAYTTLNIDAKLEQKNDFSIEL